MSAGDCERLRELGARAGARDRRRRGAGVGARAPRRLPRVPGAARAAGDARRRAAAARARRRSRRPGFEARVGEAIGTRRARAGPPWCAGWRSRRAPRWPRRPAPRPPSGSRSATTASSPTPTARRSRSPTASTSTPPPVELPGGEQVGYVYGYQGRASWVLAVIYDGLPDGRYRLEAGHRRRPPACRCAAIEVTDGRGSAGAVTPVAYERAHRGPRCSTAAGREVAESDLHDPD